MSAVARSRPFVLVSTEHGTMIASRLDFHQLASGAIYGVGAQLLGQGFYDSEEITFVLDCLRALRRRRGDGLVAVDCGANVGVHTLEMAQEMSGWGSVVAIEAQERLFYALCGNIAINNLFNATAIHAAVAEGMSEMTIPQPNYTKAGSLGSLELRRRKNTEYIGQSVSYAPKDLVPVRTVSIDGLGLPRLDLLKIDIEGMEMEALLGATVSIAEHKPSILVEHVKTEAGAIQDFLEPYGYFISTLGGNLFAEIPHNA